MMAFILKGQKLCLKFDTYFFNKTNQGWITTLASSFTPKIQFVILSEIKFCPLDILYISYPWAYGSSFKHSLL